MDTASLARTGYGWLSPAGEIVACTLHDHFAALAAAGIHPEWIARIVELAEQEATDSHEFLMSMEGEDHPSWHLFSSDAAQEMQTQRDRLLARLYMDGWVRLGSYERGRVPTIEMEGAPAILARRRASLLDLAAELGREPKLTSPTHEMGAFEVPLTHDQVEAADPAFYASSQAAYAATKVSKRWPWAKVEFVGMWLGRIDAVRDDRFEMAFRRLGRWSVTARAGAFWSTSTSSSDGAALPSAILDDARSRYRPEPPDPGGISPVADAEVGAPNSGKPS